jgi:hypothetical protein
MIQSNAYIKEMKRVIMILLLGVISCNKQFDAPPPYTGTDIQPNLSIRNLHKMHFNGNFEQVLDEWTIEGIVVADDKEDNFYKSIVLQDSTGGVTIRMDASGLYTDYPVGRRIAVKLKGLWLGDYAGMMQIGVSVDRTDPVYPELTGIPLPMFDRYLVKKDLHNLLIPKTVRIDELNDSLQSCLIRINDVEFSVSDTGRTYADVINKQSANRTLKACGVGSVYLRSGGFANFANSKTPRGNGSVTAIYSVFNKEKQLMIRDTSDVQMNGLRCTGTGAKVLFNEDFETANTNGDLILSGWKNIYESGGKLYQGKLSANNRYAEINGFASNQSSVITWLVLPPVNLSNSANELLSFQTKDGFDNGAVLQVYLSSNYDGGNTPWKAKWALLKANISKGSVAGLATDWVGSGNISLSGYSGMVYIAFRYEGADPVSATDKRTTSFQIDNVRIVGN